MSLNEFARLRKEVAWEGERAAGAPSFPKPHWKCNCGDEAPVESNREALAGAASHWDGCKLGYQAVTFAYGTTGQGLARVADEEKAEGMKRDFLSPYGCGCKEWTWDWCVCSAELRALIALRVGMLPL